MIGSREHAVCTPTWAAAPQPDAVASPEPLTEDDAAEHVHGICFKTGPPSRIGVELEWLVRDRRDPALPVDHRRVTAALAGLSTPGGLPGCGTLTTEPGGQLELSSAPAVGLRACLASAGEDMVTLRRAAAAEGLVLAGLGLDPLRPPRRILDSPRYAAMEQFFSGSGPWGRLMMCSTASVQICLDAGDEGTGYAGMTRRWQLLHAIGPALVATFANSPLRRGRPTGWKSTRQLIWSHLDPSRTRPPGDAEPGAGQRNHRPAPFDGLGDCRSAWAEYALAAEVMCVRQPGERRWQTPTGLTFRDWLRGGWERPPTLGDLTFHLSTLFPPVRPQGHLELRMIDALPHDDWAVPVAVVHALLSDATAGDEAMAASQPLWAAGASGAGRSGAGRDGVGRDGAGRDGAGRDGVAGGVDADPWLRAARRGPADPLVAAASLGCLSAAETALGRLGVPPAITAAVSAFAERYPARGRCPADDQLDETFLGGAVPGHAPIPGEDPL